MSVTALLSVGVYWGVEAGWGRLAAVEVQAAPGVGQAALFERIQSSLNDDLNAFRGRWLWEVSLAEVLDQVERDSRVASARVIRELPNRIRVVVEPKRPVVAWVDEVGRTYPVAVDATLLPAMSYGEIGDVPLLRGRIFRSDSELRRRALTLLAALPEAGPLARAQIAEIHFQKDSGFGLILVNGGIEVRLGEDDYALKAERVGRVLNYLRDQQLRGRVIDARFAKKVVVRLRNDP